MWLRFTIPLRPVSKKNSRPIFRNQKTGKSFLGKGEKLRGFEKDATAILQGQANALNMKKPILSGPIEARFFFHFKEKAPSDCSNLIEAPQDCAQKAGVLSNDKIIRELHARIIEDSGFDGIVMEFRPLSDRAASQSGDIASLKQSLGRKSGS